MNLERGSVTVLTTAVVAIAILLSYGVARLGAGAALQARADTAADAAALAAADQLALGAGAAGARRAAAETARANGAVLVDCDCAGLHAEVVVRVAAPHALAFHDARGRARAEVDAPAFSPRP